MARTDKVIPGDGNFRAPLNASYTGSATPVGVALNTNGRVITGAVGTTGTGYVGIVAIPDNKAAGDVVDVMTDGELVEFSGAAGQNYFVDAATGGIAVGTGNRTATAPATAGSLSVGWTVEATRLVVRFARVRA